VIDSDNPMNYGLIEREGNLGADGVGIGGAVLGVPDTPSSTWRGPSRSDGYTGHITVYVEVTDVEAALVRAERLVVPGHEVGSSRLTGGSPPSALCRRPVL
jgi:uncharacterized protein